MPIAVYRVAIRPPIRTLPYERNSVERRRPITRGDSPAASLSEPGIHEVDGLGGDGDGVVSRLGALDELAQAVLQRVGAGEEQAGVNRITSNAG